MIQMGELIKKARKQRGYTQIELAEMSGYCDKTIRRWERGEYEPRLRDVSACLEAMSCEIQEFLFSEAA